MYSAVFEYSGKGLLCPHEHLNFAGVVKGPISYYHVHLMTCHYCHAQVFEWIILYDIFVYLAKSFHYMPVFFHKMWLVLSGLFLNSLMTSL